jgi:hypothetical protein
VKKRKDGRRSALKVPRGINFRDASLLSHFSDDSFPEMLVY